MDNFYKEMLDEENRISTKNEKLLNQVEDLTSMDYREAVEDCLKESEASNYMLFSLVDYSTLNPKHKQDEDWDCFNHIYVDQQVDGGFTGDEFSGYIWIPITKKLYLKAHYSM